MCEGSSSAVASAVWSSGVSVGVGYFPCLLQVRPLANEKAEEVRCHSEEKARVLSEALFVN